jgi:hypothetical protein
MFNKIFYIIFTKTWIERMKCAGSTYISSIDALRQIMLSKDKEIVKISPKGYSLSNGIDYCCVGIKSNEGNNYLVQAYGEEARELYAHAVMLINNTKTETPNC